MKLILDPCCGSRMFWFDKNNPRVIFGDIRKIDHSFTDRDKTRTCKIDPDIVMDFRDMSRFNDKSFKLVVFDPPHLNQLGENSWMAKKYGKLNESWREDIKKGFEECWRVLDDFGTLIFKWNETQIKKKEILEVLERKPLFGHPTNSKNTTHWFCFMKIPKGEEPNKECKR